jgi:hypothetical protein
MVQLYSPELTGVEWQHGGFLVPNWNDNALQRI